MFVCGGGGTVITLLESFFVNSDLYIGTVLNVVGVFIHCMRNPRCRFKGLVYIGENYSLYIYLFHLLIKQGLEITEMNSALLFVWIKPLLVCLLSILVAHMYIYSQKEVEI